MITAVNICGIPHTVKYVDDLFNVDLHLGQINYAKAEILVNKDMTPAMTKETICHEMVHGILVHIGCTELSNDETFIQAMGNAINQSFEIKNIGCDSDVNK